VRRSCFLADQNLAKRVFAPIPSRLRPAATAADLAGAVSSIAPRAPIACHDSSCSAAKTCDKSLVANVGESKRTHFRTELGSQIQSRVSTLPAAGNCTAVIARPTTLSGGRRSQEQRAPDLNAKYIDPNCACERQHAC